MKKALLFFQHLRMQITLLWAKEPEVEAVVSKVISGINSISANLNSSEADIIQAAFGNTIGGKTLDEVKALLPLALEVSHVAQDGLKATDSITDPTGKANALITTVLADIAKMPEAAKSAQTLNIIAGIVSHILNMDFTEALHLVTAKSLENAHATAQASA